MSCAWSFYKIVQTVHKALYLMNKADGNYITGLVHTSSAATGS